MIKPTIIKLQRPLVGAAKDARWLVTDATRIYNDFIAFSDIPSSVKVAMGDRIKGYFHAIRTDDGLWIIGKTATKQNW